ncbi:hypothetical protein WA026_011034 [Henosepilachna vigintioctopunctata]|uniref:Uncharacterized protein n=1 Tax=Henosepilachna vigintioctopunctata TaxID=420089 RepID=A0AAW1U702_9CUCU
MFEKTSVFSITQLHLALEVFAIRLINFIRCGFSVWALKLICWKTGEENTISQERLFLIAGTPRESEPCTQRASVLYSKSKITVSVVIQDGSHWNQLLQP